MLNVEPAQAKHMFFKKKNLFAIHTININIRKTTKTVIWSVALQNYEQYKKLIVRNNI